MEGRPSPLFRLCKAREKDVKEREKKHSLSRLNDLKEAEEEERET